MISIPFSGSKRYSYKKVREIVETGGYSAVYEPFGGSCVLAVNLFNDGIVNKAVVNDYDHFFDLYSEYLDLKDKVVEEGYKRGLRRNVNCKLGEVRINPDGSREVIKSRILPPDEKEILRDIISKNVPKKYWRYFTLGNNFTHSAIGSSRDVSLSDFCMFGRYLKTDVQRAYLKALERVALEHLDWRDFINKYRAEITESKSILILDPPYIGTSQGQYKGQFTEVDTELLIKTAVELGRDFIFFNQDLALVKKWLAGLNYEIQEIGMGSITGNHRRKDVMAYIRLT